MRNVVPFPTCSANQADAYHHAAVIQAYEVATPFLAEVISVLVDRLHEAGAVHDPALKRWLMLGLFEQLHDHLDANTRRVLDERGWPA